MNLPFPDRVAVRRSAFVLSIAAFVGGALVTVWFSTANSGPGERPFLPSPASGAATTRPASARTQPAELQVPAQALQDEIADERNSVLVRAVQRVAPSVAAVEIVIRQRVNPFPTGFWDPRQRDFFERMFPFRSFTQRTRRLSGTALVLAAEGEIVTNYHVIAGAEQIFVTLADGRSAEARLIGEDRGRDLAMLEVDLDDLTPADLGNGELMVGEWVVAIGFPVRTRQSAQSSVTVGVVSATNRTFNPQRSRSGSDLYYADMIQTDAAINPGNSGGPLANAAGEVIGLNTFILTESGGSEGLGFAIPIDRILRIADEFRNYGRVRTILSDFLGQSVTEEIADILRVPGIGGLLVSTLPDGTAAQRAGLQEGDVILEVDGKPVNSMEEVYSAYSPHFVGEVVVLRVWRDGETIEIPLRLEEAKNRSRR